MGQLTDNLKAYIANTSHAQRMADIEALRRYANIGPLASELFSGQSMYTPPITIDNLRKKTTLIL